MHIEVPKETSFFCPEGIFPATLIEIRKVMNKGSFGEYQIRTVWQVHCPGLSDVDYLAGKNYHPSFEQGSDLRELVETLGFEVAGSSFDLNSLRGSKALLTIAHIYNRAHAEPYRAVVAVSPIAQERMSCNEESAPVSEDQALLAQGRMRYPVLNTFDCTPEMFERRLQPFLVSLFAGVFEQATETELADKCDYQSLIVPICSALGIHSLAGVLDYAFARTTTIDAGGKRVSRSLVKGHRSAFYRYEVKLALPGRPATPAVFANWNPALN